MSDGDALLMSILKSLESGRAADVPIRMLVDWLKEHLPEDESLVMRAVVIRVVWYRNNERLYYTTFRQELNGFHNWSTGWVSGDPLYLHLSLSKLTDELRRVLDAWKTRYRSDGDNEPLSFAEVVG